MRNVAVLGLENGREMNTSFCPSCGARQEVPGSYCVSCGSILPSAQTAQSSEPTTPNEGSAPTQPPGQAEIAPAPPVVAPATTQQPEPKSVGLALFLNFLWPGAGTLYAGVNSDMGIIFCCISGVAFLFGLVTIIGFVLTIPVWAITAGWSMIDVNRRLKEKNRSLGVAVDD